MCKPYLNTQAKSIYRNSITVKKAIYQNKSKRKKTSLNQVIGNLKSQFKSERYIAATNNKLKYFRGFCPVGTNITLMLYECSILVGIFLTNYEHFSNVQVLIFLGCSHLMSYECSILIGMSRTKNECTCNLQV